MNNLKQQLTNIKPEDCTKIAAPWRPNASGSFTYSTEIDGKKWYLERSYTWSKIDQSFFLPRYIEEAKEIWPEDKKLHQEILGVFDNDGEVISALLPTRRFSCAFNCDLNCFPLVIVKGVRKTHSVERLKLAVSNDPEISRGACHIRTPHKRMRTTPIARTGASLR